MITYTQNGQNINVYLDGKYVGKIRRLIGKGFCYFPKGQKSGGEVFPTTKEVKRSLECD